MTKVTTEMPIILKKVKMMDSQIAIGSIVYGKGGIGSQVVGFNNDDASTPIILTKNGLKTVNRAKILRVETPLLANPRDAVSMDNGRVEVDLDKLDLDYQPTVVTPEWQPTQSIKPYEQLTKLYIDIETTGLDAQIERVLMVGLMSGCGEKTILTDPDEKALLVEVVKFLRSHKPDCLIGHNLFNFDLPFLSQRCRANNLTHPFTKADRTSRITSSSVNGQPIEFTSIYWQGVSILDTFQQIAIWDKQAARLDGYGLKDSVLALGLREDRRLELDVNQIKACWTSGDLATIQEYLEFDLEDTRLLADFLLPVVYYQMRCVPNLSFQKLAIASALKIQKIHERLLPGVNPVTDEKVSFVGGEVELLKPGLHSNASKIDVSSMYPSIMLRYGVCSRKDPQHKFLGVLEYMRSERLKLKALAKAGDKSASFQEKALKVLVNTSYGYFGTGFYTFNDYAAAALITAYGRKILNLMVSVVEDCGGVTIEVDSDGIFFSHDDPETVSKQVAQALPDGIEIELELKHCGLYVPNAKNYVLVSPEGKSDAKGLFRKRNRYPLENSFPIEFLRRYFTENRAAAEAYYQEVRQSIVDGTIPVESLTTTRKIGKAEKKLVELGIGQVGDKVSFWMTKQVKYNKAGSPMKPKPVETNTDEYWSDYYVDRLDKAKAEIISN